MSEFNIDPEAINRYVAEKIVESSIGVSLRKEIDEQVKRLSSGFDNPMKPVVAQALASMAREYLESPEIKAQMKKVVSEALTDEVLQGLVSKIIKESYRL